LFIQRLTCHSFQSSPAMTCRLGFACHLEWSLQAEWAFTWEIHMPRGPRSYLPSRRSVIMCDGDVYWMMNISDEFYGQPAKKKAVQHTRSPFPVQGQIPASAAVGHLSHFGKGHGQSGPSYSCVAAKQNIGATSWEPENLVFWVRWWWSQERIGAMLSCKMCKWLNMWYVMVVGLGWVGLGMHVGYIGSVMWDTGKVIVLVHYSTSII
jgi:hypothetical protein